MVDDNELRKWLALKSERDWLDFKQECNLFDTNGKVKNDKERDELIKDVLGLANGNTRIIRKSKYLIIGVDDKQFDSDGMRVLHNVDYRMPTQSEITQWVNGACTPAVVGIECKSAPVNGKNLYIIMVPPTFDLHETTRDLITKKSKHSKHTVFMRQDEHTDSASVRDGAAIQQLKLLHRQEIANASSIRFGIIIGALFALIFWNIGYNSPNSANSSFSIGVQILLVTMGGILGAEFGYIYQQLNVIRYDWRYMARDKRGLLMIFGLFACIMLGIAIRHIL